MTGSSTGVLSYSVAMSLTTGPVYLPDMICVPIKAPATGRRHPVGQRLQARWPTRPAVLASTISGGNGRRVVPGNNGENVDSLVWWDRFRQELGLLSSKLKADNRVAYNVNAHHRIGARIEHTEAAPLPDPDSLPDFTLPTLPEGKQQRLDDLYRRLANMPEDTERFRKHLKNLRDRISKTRARPTRDWNIKDLADRLSTQAEISDDNKTAFSYFLRSALHNSTAEYHRLRRSPNKAQGDWLGMNCMDNLCEGLDHAVEQIKPRIEHIIEECTHVS